MSSKVRRISFSVQGSTKRELEDRAQKTADRFFLPSDDETVIVTITASPFVVSDDGNILSWEGDASASLMGPTNPIGHEEVG